LKNYTAFASLIPNWARFALSHPSFQDWSPLQRFCETAESYSEEALKELHDLLDQTDLLFRPFCDPLRADIGLNRWLSAEREES